MTEKSWMVSSEHEQESVKVRVSITCGATLPDVLEACRAAIIGCQFSVKGDLVFIDDEFSDKRE